MKNVFNIWQFDLSKTFNDISNSGNEKTTNKRYLIIDKQIARHLCNTVNVFQTPFSFMQFKQLTPFLNQGSQPITIKGLDFSPS